MTKRKAQKIDSLYTALRRNTLYLLAEDYHVEFVTKCLQDAHDRGVKILDYLAAAEPLMRELKNVRGGEKELKKELNEQFNEIRVKNLTAWYTTGHQAVLEAIRLV